MNRVIKFRARIAAKDNQGEWAYGEFSHDSIGNAFLNWWTGTEWRHTSVDENTLGQFTGLLDKNGKEIYEGDILAVEYEAPQVVRWNDAFAQFGMSFVTGATTNIPSNAFIAGNIYENPDLI